VEGRTYEVLIYQYLVVLWKYGLSTFGKFAQFGLSTLTVKKNRTCSFF